MVTKLINSDLLGIIMEDDLETILSAFDQVCEWFQRPSPVSNENPDVTVKYLISMLQLAPNEEEQQHLIDGFANRFHADREQLRSLLSDPHNWVDYSLYTAFSLYCQQQLGMDDATFFAETARKTFLNYQDGQIRQARYIPLNWVLGGMGGQFKNWTRVTDVTVEKLRQGEHSFRITRRTKDEYRRRLAQSLGDETLSAVLFRDCSFTQAAFEVTFQELFGQKDLQVQRSKSEGYGDGESEYVIIPSSPYKSRIEDYWERAKAVFYRTMLPWVENSRLREESNGLKREVFVQEQTIQARTDDLSQANAKLERRQGLIVKLLGDISRLRSSGERHAVRNYLHVVRERETDRLIGEIADRISFTYHTLREDKTAQRQLEHLCTSFGLSPSSLMDRSAISGILHRVQLTKSPAPAPADDFFAGFTAQDIYLSVAAEDFQRRKDHLALSTDHPLFHFNPFLLLYSLQTIEGVVQEVNARFSSIGELAFLETVRFSEAVAEAREYAQREKQARLEVTTALDFDPELKTNRDALVYVIRDLLYNAIDAGATQFHVVGKQPAKEDGLFPYEDRFAFVTAPSFYIRCEDNGAGISFSKAEQLNEYLKGNASVGDDLSTKEKDHGGLGTENMRNFFRLHSGHGYYERVERGTCVHMYLERLEI